MHVLILTACLAAEPSACADQPRVMVMGRSSSTARPSARGPLADEDAAGGSASEVMAPSLAARGRWSGPHGIPLTHAHLPFHHR